MVRLLVLIFALGVAGTLIYFLTRGTPTENPLGGIIPVMAQVQPSTGSEPPTSQPEPLTREIFGRPVTEAEFRAFKGI